MPTKYLPSKDMDLRAFANQFAQTLSSDPVSFGITPAIAATYSQKAAAFDSALSAAVDPQTRGLSTVFRKEQAKADLIAYTRLVVRSVQGCMTVTDTLRQQLGITIRANPTRIAKPAVTPSLDVLDMQGRRLTLRAYETGTATRAKPTGVAGVNVYCVIAKELAGGADNWTLLASSTRARFDVMLPANLTPGTTVWLSARYFNPRSQQGPGGNPIRVIIGSVGLEFGLMAA